MRAGTFFSLLLLVAFAVPGAAQDSSPPTADYLIGPGDLLRVVVYDAPDLSGEMRVSNTGFILVPLLPDPVRAQGLTVEGLAMALEREYEGRELLRTPRLTVLVLEHKSRMASVLGAVREPQRVPIIGPMTLMELLVMAGGPSDDAGNLVYVTRRARVPGAAVEGEDSQAAEPRTRVVNLRDLIEARNPDANISIYAGDLVTVPRAGVVYVVGAVHKPGGFRLQGRQERLTALQAIALAGNTTGTARPGDTIIIRRPAGSDEEQAIAVDLRRVRSRQAPDPVLRENDILFVPDSPIKKGLRRAMDAAIQITTGLIIIPR
ncbi:MAG: polysaccharide biosynthesis/export family protein [Terriglobia bacterium]